MANLSTTRAVNNSPNVEKTSFQFNSKFSEDLGLNNRLNNFNILKNFNNVNNSNNFKILHQNIRGILHKTDEFLTSLVDTSPHILCLTEHHLRFDELKNINFSPYTLGVQFCQQFHKQGEVSIFVSSNIQFQTINLDHFNREKDLETCALKIDLLPVNLKIICIYRSPTGNFKYFINQLEALLNSFYKVSTYFILCGDFNINHLEVSSRKCQIESLLASFNLFSTVTFPTRIVNNSSTLIDNIYIDTNTFYSMVYPLVNGLSDHDAQIIELQNLFNINLNNHYKFTRRIDSYSILTFIDSLSYENWVEVFLEDNVNIIFNNFLNIFLRNFNASFPVVKRKEYTKSNPWLTTGIRISCITKRKLYVIYRNSMDPNDKAYYKKYCKILSSVTRAAKKCILIH
jgi:exonuclease III